MKGRRFGMGRRMAGGALACCLALLAATATAKDKPQEATPPAKASAAQDAMMAEMMKYAMPGPQHDLLKPMAGTWKVTAKMWAGPGDPQVSEGRCVNAWILGGRYLQSTYTSEFNGQPFEGMGLVGYDRMANKFVNLWLDTMSTTYMESKGEMDAAGKVMTCTGSYVDPATAKPVSFRLVTRIVDANQHVFSMYAPQDGKEQLQMEITYSRAQ